MQRAVFQNALVPSTSTTLGRCRVHPAIPIQSHRQLYSRSRRPTAHSQVHHQHHHHNETPLRVRAISPSPSPSSFAAYLSTVAVAEATRNPSDGRGRDERRRDNDDPSSVMYVGPLTSTFRRLKIFSLSSLVLASSLSPFIFIVESSLPSTARAALATTALVTSGVSTALVAWCGRPYVTTLRRLTTSSTSTTSAPTTSTSTATTATTAAPTTASPTSEAQQEGQQQQQQQQQTTNSHNENAPAGIELTTLTLSLSPLTTRVYDPLFLGDTTRAFARWELARSVQLPLEDAAGVLPGAEETVAETLNRAGDVLGRWIVTWGENGEGSCHAQGRVER